MVLRQGRIGSSGSLSMHLQRSSAAPGSRKVRPSGAKQPNTLLFCWQSVRRSRRLAFQQSLFANARRLTRRSRGGPTACHQGPPAGTVYIVYRRALASHRWPPP
jgi:hypothetical protein